MGGNYIPPTAQSGMTHTTTTSGGTSLPNAGNNPNTSAPNVSPNLYAGGGTGINYPSVNTYTTGYAQTIEKEYCELCGDEIEVTWTAVKNDIPELCDKCFGKIQKELVIRSIPRNSKVHCATCHKHIKACKCPDSESLRAMNE